MKTKLTIQTVSDIITNSSSEVFCRISSDDENLIDRVYEWINKCLGFPENKDSDLYIKCQKQEPVNGEYGLLLTSPYCIYQDYFLLDAVDAILRRDFKEDFTKIKTESYPDEYN